MADCDLCGLVVDLPFRCKNCGFSYCEEHRFMWKHHCGSVQSKPERSSKKSVTYRPYKVSYRRSWYIKRFFKFSIIPLAIVLIFMFANPLQLVSNKTVTLNENIQTADQNSQPSPQIDRTVSQKNDTAQVNPFINLLTYLDSAITNLSSTASHAVAPSKDELYQMALTDINSYRSQNGLKPVSLLNSPASQTYADLLLSEKCIHHLNDDGTTPQGRFHALGQDSNVIAENVWGGSVSISIQSTLQKSNYDMMFNDHLVKNGGLNVGTIDNGHRMNILNPSHQYVSLGVAYDLNNFVLVEDFEDPLGPNEYVPTSAYAGTPDPKSCW